MRIGEYKKRSVCSKGKHIDKWLRDENNRSNAKIPKVAEEDVDQVIKLIMGQMIDNKLIHAAEKPDNVRRIFTSDTLVWDPKKVWSWDYDGPAVRILCFLLFRE